MVTDEQIEHERRQHARVGSYFLGPRAENFELLSEFFTYVLNEQKDTRENLYKDDPAFITQDMIKTEEFQGSIAQLREDVKDISKKLSTNSIPFWSPRYNAHMNMDTAMPSIIGYMAAMMYNPNNVATEASPYTTGVEHQVGGDLCRMLGYGYGVGGEDSDVEPWGHITCDGSVANLEAIWAIRNLKFYPLSLKLAMAEGAPLNFLTRIKPPFKVSTCKGEEKPFTELSTWELLNLKPTAILQIPTRLTSEYAISATFLQTALKDYLIQTVGKEYVDQKFGITKPAKFFVSATKHYSWPKGGAISGLGSDNFVDIAVDEEARMDISSLRAHLESCIEGDDESQHTPVFGGVVIIGSTEHGACDPLRQVVELREEFQARGLSFAIHCDAAWGGYFSSMIERRMFAPVPGGDLPFVPKLAIQPYTREQLEFLPFADSITIDPHKSGYINYPAGGLCYRDQRFRMQLPDQRQAQHRYQANYLNQRIFKRLSYTIEDDATPISDRPLFLTSSSFSEKAYGKCLTNFKRRLELSNNDHPAHGDLSFLVNVTMSPWPTDSPFLESLVTSFRKIAEEEVQHVLARNIEKPDIHGFVVQGHDKVYLVHIPMFNMAAHRWQVIITAELPGEVKELYQKLRKENPDKFYTIANVEPEKLGNLLESTGDVEFRMDDGIPADGAEPLAKFKLSDIQVVVKRSMSYDDLDRKYPDRMPFYLYGSNAEANIDHVLRTSPNAQLSGDRVKLNLNPALSDEQLGKGVVSVLEDVYENSIQPLPQEENEEGTLVIKTDAPGLSLVPDHKHRVSVYNNYDDFLGGSKPIASGDLSLTSKIFADWGMVNMD
ncbi:pyridoxal phosphate-dependent transferase [Fusarium oxysporum]|nr:pyridoxal phosphate-dependent transferase [Fusarium oxysporum]